jgi:hypothetical protein
MRETRDERFLQWDSLKISALASIAWIESDSLLFGSSFFGEE